MAKVVILAAVHISWRRVTRRLTRNGYTVDGARVYRGGEPDAVSMKSADLTALGDIVLDPAARVLGLRPRDGIECVADGGGQSLAWPIVVDIARAVAAEVPLAVVDDGAGANYLVNPARGLVAPPEGDQVNSSFSTGEMLRRLLGEGGYRRR